jgi:tetratricopeptide (TPR) repeat protein
VIRVRWFAVSLLLAEMGCHSQGAAPRASEPVAVDAEAALALAPVVDAGPASRRVTRAQERARREDSPEAWVALGHAWIRKARADVDPGLHHSARAAATLARRVHPGDRRADALEATLLASDHRFDEARALAESVLRADSTDRVALAAVSDAAFELGDVEAAVAAAQQMVDLKPDLASYARAAHLRWIHGDAGAAKALMRSAIDAAGGDREALAWALVESATLFWHEGDYAGAAAGCERALEAMPDYPPALVCAGRAALSAGDAARAVAFLERARARTSTVELNWLLGDALAATGDDAGAETAWGWARRDGRSDALALGLFLTSRTRDVREAVRLLEAEHAVRPSLQVVEALAWALHRAGRTDEAARLSDAALRLGTPDARWWFHAGAIRIARGDVKAGRAMLRRALRLNPRFDARDAEEAAALLKSSANGRVVTSAEGSR